MSAVPCLAAGRCGPAPAGTARRVAAVLIVLAGLMATPAGYARAPQLIVIAAALLGAMALVYGACAARGARTGAVALVMLAFAAADQLMAPAGQGDWGLMLGGVTALFLVPRRAPRRPGGAAPRSAHAQDVAAFVHVERRFRDHPAELPVEQGLHEPAQHRAVR